MSIEIRPAVINDIADFAELEYMVRTIAVERGELPAVDIRPKELVKDILRRKIESEDCVMFVAKVGGEIVGKGGVHFYPDRGYASLYSCEVLPAAEGLGIALDIFSTAVTMI